jgi:hypothetical protein
MRKSAVDRWLGIGVLAVVLITAGVLLARRQQAPRLVRIKTPDVMAPILYREAGPVATGMTEPRGIAVTHGQLYVVGDTVEKAYTRDGTMPRDTEIKEFTRDGTVVRTIPLSRPARCIGVSPDGTLYVGGQGGIDVITNRGHAMRRTHWRGRTGAVMTSLAAGPTIIWAADASNRIVIGYTVTGKAAITLKDFVVPSGQLDVAGDDQGVAVSNPGGLSRVQRFTRDGTLTRQWGSTGPHDGAFSGCCNPAHLARLPDGGVVTSEKGYPRVQVFDADGALQGLVADPKTFAGNTQGMDVATDDAGRIYLLDGVKRQVRVFIKR